MHHVCICLLRFSEPGTFHQGHSKDALCCSRRVFVGLLTGSASLSRQYASNCSKRKKKRERESKSSSQGWRAPVGPQYACLKFRGERASWLQASGAGTLIDFEMIDFRLAVELAVKDGPPEPGPDPSVSSVNPR